MAITTLMADTFKQELLMGGHCFNATLTPTVTATSASTAVTNVSTGLNGVTLGMAVTGTGVAAGSYVVGITASNAFTLSTATTAAITGGTVTITGDTFKMALIKSGSGITYNDTSSNYSSIPATDETSGTGYTATGQVLFNVTPTLSGTQGITNFNPAPTWPSATFSTSGCMIYNTSARTGSNTLAGTGRACGVFDFGGTQTVSSGQFTVVMPTASSGSAILRIS